MRTVIWGLALAACGGGSTDKLDIVVANAPVVVLRDGDSWKPVQRDAAGAATLEIDGPTQLALVCDDGSYVNYYTLFLGPGIDDAKPIDVSCAAPAQYVTITINAPQTTDVFVGFSRNFAGNTITAQAGTYDVIAVDDSTQPPRFEIRRNVSIAQGTTLTFDLAATGMPLVSTTVTVTGADAGETASPTTTLYTENRTYAFVSATGTTGWLFPRTAVLATDRQTVSAGTAHETRGNRSARRAVVGDETQIALALPPYLTSVTPSPMQVAWQATTEFESFYYGINSPDFMKLWDVTVFAEWTKAGGDVDLIAIPDPSTIPGWQPRWELGPTAGYEWYFSASRDREPDGVSASLSGEL